MVDDVATIFRDRVISDRIAFQYGTMTPEAAVSDFLGYCDNIRQQLLDEGKDPSDHLLTVALDGENWMFMSEFQHQDNGRPFTEEWFGRLSTHPTIVTTTPGEFLEKNLTLPEIDVIGTGSWIDGTFQLGQERPKKVLLGNVWLKHVRHWSHLKQRTRMIRGLMMLGKVCTLPKVVTGFGGMGLTRIADMMRCGTFFSRCISPIFIVPSTRPATIPARLVDQPRSTRNSLWRSH